MYLYIRRIGSTSRITLSRYTPVNEHLFRALAQFWNPAYICFTFG
ncbi:hypothetical protein V6Z11_A08G059100 [Gossypium hirsutum]